VSLPALVPSWVTRKETLMAEYPKTRDGVTTPGTEASDETPGRSDVQEGVAFARGLLVALAISAVLYGLVFAILALLW
jgi:hypothetical protein